MLHECTAGLPCPRVVDTAASRTQHSARPDGPKRRHYRLFCLLERDGAKVGLGGPSLVLLAGKDKPFQTVLTVKSRRTTSGRASICRGELRLAHAAIRRVCWRMDATSV
jgi:hypothetical protein